jgi:hypothetical protein
MKLSVKQKLCLIIATSPIWLPFVVLWLLIVDIYEATIDN